MRQRRSASSSGPACRPWLVINSSLTCPWRIAQPSLPPHRVSTVAVPVQLHCSAQGGTGAHVPEGVRRDYGGDSTPATRGRHPSPSTFDPRGLGGARSRTGVWVGQKTHRLRTAPPPPRPLLHPGGQEEVPGGTLGSTPVSTRRSLCRWDRYPRCGGSMVGPYVGRPLLEARRDPDPTSTSPQVDSVSLGPFGRDGPY